MAISQKWKKTAREKVDMAEFNEKAKTYFEWLSEEEQEKALSILMILDGLEIERARWILSFCKSSLETKAIVKI